MVSDIARMPICLVAKIYWLRDTLLPFWTCRSRSWDNAAESNLWVYVARQLKSRNGRSHARGNFMSKQVRRVFDRFSDLSSLSRKSTLDRLQFDISCEYFQGTLFRIFWRYFPTNWDVSEIILCIYICVYIYIYTQYSIIKLKHVLAV